MSDVREHVLLDILNVRCGKPMTQPFNKAFAAYILTAELFDSFLKMPEVKRDIVPDIPLKVKPVSPFDATLPRTINQRVHFTGI